jgi:hypothetical protein
MAQIGRRSHRPDEDTTRYEYRVVIAGWDRAVQDDELVHLFAEYRDAIARDLTARAMRRFGPAYFVEVTPARPTASIRSTVLLGVRYPVQATATMIYELRRFAGEIEVAIADALEQASPARLAVAAEFDEESAPVLSGSGGAGSKGGAAAWERIAPILAVVATGIGVIGFATFVGGAIEWARFHATGLPQEEALSIVPTADLTVVGARILVPAILYGLVASAVYLIAIIVSGRREERIPDPSERTKVEQHGDAVRALFLVAVVVGGEFLAFFTTLTTLGALQFVAFFVIGVLMAALVFSVGWVTNSFVYLAATVFLALSLFLGGVSYVRAFSTPELRGAAVVRNNERAIIGFFVAENGSRVYLARLDTDSLAEGEIERSTARLIGIQKDQITDIEVGPPSAPQEALEQASDMADELCGLETAAAPPIPKNDNAARNCWDKRPGVIAEP